MKISVIIINYNTDDLTVQAVNSIFQNTKESSFDIEIIVVDNNSKMTNLDKRLLSFKNLQFYQLKENIGFGRANNVGFSKSTGDYIFLLNSDAYLIDNETLEVFIAYLKSHQNVACVSGNLITEKNELNISYGNFLKVDRILHDYGFKKFSKPYFEENLSTSKLCRFTSPTKVDYLTAAALLIKREVIEKLGLFDPKYFMYYEDMDLCFRFAKNGYFSVILPSVKIVHIGGQSGLNSTESNVSLNNQIQYSKMLFLRNQTNNFHAYFLYFLIKTMPYYFRIKNKLKVLLK